MFFSSGHWASRLAAKFSEKSWRPIRHASAAVTVTQEIWTPVSGSQQWPSQAWEYVLKLTSLNLRVFPNLKSQGKGQTKGCDVQCCIYLYCLYRESVMEYTYHRTSVFHFKSDYSSLKSSVSNWYKAVTVADFQVWRLKISQCKIEI